LLFSDANEFQKYISKPDAGDGDAGTEDADTVDMLEKTEREDHIRRRFGAEKSKPAAPEKKAPKKRDMFDVSLAILFQFFYFVCRVFKKLDFLT